MAEKEEDKEINGDLIVGEFMADCPIDFKNKKKKQIVTLKGQCKIKNINLELGKKISRLVDVIEKNIWWAWMLSLVIIISFSIILIINIYNGNGRIDKIEKKLIINSEILANKGKLLNEVFLQASDNKKNIDKIIEKREGKN